MKCGWVGSTYVHWVSSQEVRNYILVYIDIGDVGVKPSQPRLRLMLVPSSSTPQKIVSLQINICINLLWEVCCIWQQELVPTYHLQLAVLLVFAPSQVKNTGWQSCISQRHYRFLYSLLQRQLRLSWLLWYRLGWWLPSLQVNHWISF